MPNVLGQNNARFRVFLKPSVSGATFGSEDQFYEERKLWVYQFGSKHFIPGMRLRMQTDISYSDGQRNVLDLKTVQYIMPEPGGTIFDVDGALEPPATTELSTMQLERFTGLIGIALILGLAFLASNNRKAINYRLVGSGLLLQVVIALLVLKVAPVTQFFQWLGRGMGHIEEFARAGAAVQHRQPAKARALQCQLS